MSKCAAVSSLCPVYDTASVSSYIHTYTRLMALCPGLPWWASTRKVKPIWILLKQETASGSGISWAVCKSAPRSRQITVPTTTTQFFYRPDALPAAQPTASNALKATNFSSCLFHSTALPGDTTGVLWGSQCWRSVCSYRRWRKFHAADIQQSTSLRRLRHSVQAARNGPAGWLSVLLSYRGL